MQLLPLLLGEHTAIRCTISHHQCRIKVVMNDNTFPLPSLPDYTPLALSSITIATEVAKLGPKNRGAHEGASLGSKGINA